MMTYIVISICIFLLLLVVYISAKPISMGIEARRNIKESVKSMDESNDGINDNFNDDAQEKSSIADEILKLNDLKNKGVLTEEEYKKAKEKLLD